MSRRYRLLILLTCLALACAGLPAHACAESAENQAETQVEQTATEASAPCPHHAPPVSDPVTQHADASTDGEDSTCCGLDCTCRCGATAPALTLLVSPGAETMHSGKLSFLGAIAPSLTPERLLRPPIPSA